MFEFLYNLIIKPIYVFIEFLFNYINWHSNNLGLTIFLISMFVSVICLPLYLKADELQEEEKNIQAKLKDKVQSIKRNYKGDERQLLLQTYYRQNNYHPIMGLRLSLSLLLQIPIFCAAYTFFNDLPLLDGASFWAINDLSKPDGLLSVAGFSINVYPILMTIINLLSGYIYCRGRNFKENTLLFAVSLVFLILLYNSPSGLVLYWTYNNWFSLIKNICLRFMSREKLIKYTCIMAFIVYCIVQKNFNATVDILTFAFIIILIFYGKILKQSVENILEAKKLFFLSVTAILLFIGAYIPSNIIMSSPTDFIFNTTSPFGIIFYSITVYAGIFLFWGSCLFYLANSKIKKILALCSLSLLAFSVVNFFLIKIPEYPIDRFLRFETMQVDFSNYVFSYAIYACILVLFIAVIIALLFFKKENILRRFVCGVIITTLVLVFNNSFRIQNVLNKYYSETKKEFSESQKYINLSKTNKNVIIIFLDRFNSSYLPIVFEEFPELKKQFEGFVYYPNTLSYSRHTIVGYPPILGGYEYTPHRMDERDGQFEEKFKQAVTVLPAIFAKHNWNTNIINPEDLGWQKYTKWGVVSDKEAKLLSSDELYKKHNIKYEEIPDGIVPEMVRKNNLKGEELSKTNILYYNFLPVLPPNYRNMLYNKGRYYHINKKDEKQYDANFLKCYYELNLLNKYTGFTSAGNTFVVFNNDLPHSPRVLSYPNYDLSNDNDETYVPNIKFKDDKFVLAHYHVDVATLRFIGQYFDFLRKNNVYNNSRIIIVSDHGFQLPNHEFNKFLFSVFSPYNPLLLVKDFNSSGDFKESTDFMTNGDVPILATQGLISDPENPYTGKKLSSAEKEKGVIINTWFRWQPKYYVQRTQIIDNNAEFQYVKGSPRNEKSWKTKLTKQQALEMINN